MNKVTTIILILLSAHLFSQTIISGGDIEGTWSTSGNPYFIDGDITVNTGERLAIEPGVKIIFNGPYSIEVYGRLDASGTTNDSIVFTVADTTGFASGSYSGWYGIAFFGPSTTPNDYSYLTYCRIEYSALSGVTCINYDNLIISHSTLRNNRFSGISLMEFSDVTIDHIAVTGNGNAGISVQSSAPEVYHFLVADNHGSGIKIEGNSNSSLFPHFNEGIISNNHTGLFGGGISVGMDAFATIENVIVKNNSALKGGGIYSSFGILTLKNLEVRSNTAQFGGGIFNNNYSVMTINHTLIAGNTAFQTGGAIYVYESETTMDHMTIANNTATVSTSGLFFDLMTSLPNTITNSIIYQNLPDEIGMTNLGPDIIYTNISGGFDGEGNMDANPRFVDMDKGNYKLSWAGYPNDSKDRSPCIDAADPSASLDPDGTNSDMGYTYFHQTQGILTTNSGFATASVFPNPAKNEIFINADEEIVNATIHNLSGHEVMRFSEFRNYGGLNIAALKAGIYILKMQTPEGRMITEKLIKN